MKINKCGNSTSVSINYLLIVYYNYLLQCTRLTYDNKINDSIDDNVVNSFILFCMIIHFS